MLTLCILSIVPSALCALLKQLCTRTAWYELDREPITTIHNNRSFHNMPGTKSKAALLLVLPRLNLIMEFG